MAPALKTQGKPRGVGTLPKAKKAQKQVTVDLLDFKEPLVRWCEENGISTSKVIRRLVAEFLKLSPETLRGNAAAAILAQLPSSGLTVAEGESERRSVKKSVFVRLTPSEYEQAIAVSNSDQFSLQRWFVAALRARLTKDPQFGQRELEVLARSNKELWAVGRDLNKIAKALSGGADVPVSFRVDLIEDIERVIKAHTQHVSALTAASYERWRIE